MYKFKKKLTKFLWKKRTDLWEKIQINVEKREKNIQIYEKTHLREKTHKIYMKKNYTFLRKKSQNVQEKTYKFTLSQHFWNKKLNEKQKYFCLFKKGI